MFRRIALGLIRFYQKGISPFTRPSCRFAPTCSAYAYEAIERYGALRGGWLFLKRFGRCHPFGGKGYDPVPLPADERARVTPGAPRPPGSPLPSSASRATENPVPSATPAPHGTEDSGKARAVS